MDERVTPDVMKDIFCPNEGTLKFLCRYLNGGDCQEEGSRRGFLEDVDGS